MNAPHHGALALLLLAIGGGVHAADIRVTVTDAAGVPLRDAVIYALPLDQSAPPTTASHVVDQIDRQFVPMVSVVQTGTRINFPNKDDIRHHVYSFSPAKTFDLKLYHGTPAEPVVFDRPGTVILGCNIHDRMVAYIEVVDTPWFAMTDASGTAGLKGLPAGRYRLAGWHFRLADAAHPPEMELRIADGEALAEAMSLPLGEAPTQPLFEE